MFVVVAAEWRVTHDALITQVTSSADMLDAMALLGDTDSERLAGQLRTGLRRWTDPYAPDALGAPALSNLLRVCQRAPHRLQRVVSGVVRVLADARRRGATRDVAESERAAAIVARVRAVGNWRRAAVALLDAVPALQDFDAGQVSDRDTSTVVRLWFEE